MKPQRLDNIRNLIKTWLYMAQRETFLRGTKKCGFYDPLNLPHGGPAQLDTEGNPDYNPNQATRELLTPEEEFTGYKTINDHLIPKSIEIFQVRPPTESHRNRRYAPDAVEERQRRAVLSAEIAAKIAEYDDQLDGDFDDDDIDRDDARGPSGFARLERENPCKAIKQVFTGFKKWSLRYIGNCDGQATYQHMLLRSLKFYDEFKGVCREIQT